MGAADGQFWRGAFELVVGDWATAGSVGADVGLVVGIAGDDGIGGVGINPGATEVCDGIDNNCDGQIDGVIVTPVTPLTSSETQSIPGIADVTVESGSEGDIEFVNQTYQLSIGTDL